MVVFYVYTICANISKVTFIILKYLKLWTLTKNSDVEELQHKYSEIRMNSEN